MASSSSSPLSSSSTLSPSTPLFTLHHHSRSSNKSYPPRQSVPDEKVKWEVEWSEYQPTDFTTQNAIQKSSDPVDPSTIPNLSSRFSYTTRTHANTNANSGSLRLDPSDGRPLNPYGRTGLKGRGKLYNWGPNHAADPIVTRLSTSASSSSSSPSSSSRVLEVVVIRRGDTGSWALPGGMIDKGETPTEALKREFKEEALAPKQNKDKDNKDDAKSSSSRRSEVDDLADRIFSSSSNDCIYTGYIDDIRNTDNAWLESYCHHYHLSDPSLVSQLDSYLHAGDDANEVKWLRIDASEQDFQQLYGSHKQILERCQQKWEEKQKQ